MCTGASEGRKKWNGSSAPGGVMGPPKGVPHSGGSGGPPPGNFLNLDCKSFILGTSRGDTNDQITKYFYGF